MQVFIKHPQNQRIFPLNNQVKEQSSKKLGCITFLRDLFTKEGIPLKGESFTSYSRFDSRYDVTNNSLYFRTQSIKELRLLTDK